MLKMPVFDLAFWVFLAALILGIPYSVAFNNAPLTDLRAWTKFAGILAVELFGFALVMG